MIDWEKLKPYENAKWKSFEEFCYQIAKRQFNNSGEFTPVDDSGGGDGVEFYLMLPNGDEWGWQAKFFYPNPRLKGSGRKNSIKKSLKKSIKVHPNLKKWFICTPTSFTTKENIWFASLKSFGPNIEIKHWGKSEFNDFLSKPRFAGIKNYFFGELELDIDWFSSQVKKQISNVKEKYIAPLHTESDAEFKIHCLLADSKFIKFVKENLNKMKYGLNNFSENKREFEKINLNPIPIDLQTKILKALNNFDECQMKILLHIQSFLILIEDGFIEKALDFELRNNDNLREEIENLRDYSSSIHKLIRESPKEQKDSILYIWNDKLYKLLDYLNEFELVFFDIERAIGCFKKSEINIFGEAEIGKTHISCHICEERVNNNLPAILLLGRDFTRDKPIEKKILEILDIPSQYSRFEFLSVLESMAEAYRTRIPIVIDALNESETTDIWKNQLLGFTESLKKYPRIILIKTCRTLYIDSIWETKPQNYIYIYGFNETNSEEAVIKYFSYYKIKADLTLISLNQFKHPFFLKLFCEINNPERKEEKQVYLGEQSLYKVIEEYLTKCNEKISCKLSRLPKFKIIQGILKKFAGALWINSSRDMNFPDAIKLFDNKSKSELDWNNSFTKALLDEGLLISRNM
jgi:hypothetical protein